MRRESVFVCTYTNGDGERVAHVRAWDDREAADLFARELELDADGVPVELALVHVRPVFPAAGDRRSSPAAGGDRGIAG
jgi:hypothetical protein